MAPPRKQFTGETLAPPPGTPVERVHLADITDRPEFQVRHQTNPKLVKKYISSYANGATMPPVGLARLNGVLILYDGFHRVEAQRFLKLDFSDAVIHEAKSTDAIRMWAFLANMSHGQSLSQSERFASFKLFMKMKRHRGPNGKLLSYREMAETLCGTVPRSTLQRWMMQHYPKLAAQMGALPTYASKETPTPTNNESNNEEQQSDMDCTTARDGIRLALAGIGRLSMNGDASSTVRALQTWAMNDLNDALKMIDDVTREQDRTPPAMIPGEDF